MRLTTAVVLLVLAASAATAAVGGTSLRVVVRASADASPRVTTLRCDPPGGTLARPASACRQLLSVGRALIAPTPPGTACSQIYGGPQEAIVTGTLEGTKVWARFRRRDGCELSRWNRVAFLLGPPRS
jgi:hypothetical protein